MTGWTVSYRPPDMAPADHIAELCNVWWSRHAVKHETTKEAVFVLARYTAADDEFRYLSSVYFPNDKGEIFTIRLWLYDKAGLRIPGKPNTMGSLFSRQELDETDGPTVHGPPALIAEASPIKSDDEYWRRCARRWRERSLVYHATKAVHASGP